MKWQAALYEKANLLLFKTFLVTVLFRLYFNNYRVTDYENTFLFADSAIMEGVLFIELINLFFNVKSIF